MTTKFSSATDAYAAAALCGYVCTLNLAFTLGLCYFIQIVFFFFTSLHSFILISVWKKIIYIIVIH